MDDSASSSHFYHLGLSAPKLLPEQTSTVRIVILPNKQ